MVNAMIMNSVVQIVELSSMTLENLLVVLSGEEGWQSDHCSNDFMLKQSYIKISFAVEILAAMQSGDLLHEKGTLFFL